MEHESVDSTPSNPPLCKGGRLLNRTLAVYEPAWRAFAGLLLISKSRFQFQRTKRENNNAVAANQRACVASKA